MKIIVTLKDPDTLIDAIHDAVERNMKECDDNDKEAARQKALKISSKWFKYSEYLTIEIDTEAQTCLVVPIAL